MAEMKCRCCGRDITENQLWSGEYCSQSPNQKHQAVTVTEMKCCYCGRELTENQLWSGEYCSQSPNQKHLLT